MLLDSRAHFGIDTDISGQDIRAHHNRADELIVLIRDWLNTHSKRGTIPGGREISRRYQAFATELPRLCQDLKIEREEMTFKDFAQTVQKWIAQPHGE